MSETAVLYALSTLAQTCAALAALVGAVGLYRLQALRGERGDVYYEIYTMLGRPTKTPDAAIAEARRRAPDAVMQDALRRFDELPAIIRRSGRWLCVFEAWNLLVILSSLVGFAYIPFLTGQWWSSLALWIAALGTVGLTGYGVFAWFE
jgi:hypothetical protein